MNRALTAALAIVLISGLAPAKTRKPKPAAFVASVAQFSFAYEADAEAFAALWQPADAAEAERVLRAQRLLPSVRVPETILHGISERCLAADVEGLRADLTLCKAASAWAAYQGRTEVEPGDVDAVAELALAHRRTHSPQPPATAKMVSPRPIPEPMTTPLVRPR